MASQPLTRAADRRREERAREALSSFLDRTRYPPGSRPFAERPELAVADFVPPRSLPVGPNAGEQRRVVLTQDRMDVAAGGRATVTITCREGSAELPCSVDEAHWQVPTPTRKGTLSFQSAGARGGVWRAEVSPEALGLDGLSVPFFLSARVRMGDDALAAHFELTLTGEAPAHFTGEVREALEQGSLALHVGVAVAKPGRYVVRARVDQASGGPLAYLSETAELTPGDTEVKLTLFGKLLRDEGARGPFVLRDVEGYRLLPDTYPDRERMTTWVGELSRIAEVPLESLSDAAWESPEKARMRRMLEAEVR